MVPTGELLRWGLYTTITPSKGIVMRTVCLYRANDIDAVTAAWIVWNYCTNTEFYPMERAGDLPTDVTGTRLVLIGHELDDGTLGRALRQAGAVTYIGRQQEVSPWMANTIDMWEELTDTGCHIGIFEPDHALSFTTWKYFFGEEEPLMILRHIDDHITGANKYSETPRMIEALSSHPIDLETWKTLGLLEHRTVERLMARPAKIDDTAQVALRALEAKLEEAIAAKNQAYQERNHVVALLAHLFPSGIRPTKIEGWDPEWSGCVYIDLPGGKQISYHYHSSEVDLFKKLPAYAKPYDGHTKEDVHALLKRCIDMNLPLVTMVSMSRDMVLGAVRAVTNRGYMSSSERDGFNAKPRYVENLSRQRQSGYYAYEFGTHPDTFVHEEAFPAPTEFREPGTSNNRTIYALLAVGDLLIWINLKTDLIYLRAIGPAGTPLSWEPWGDSETTHPIDRLLFMEQIDQL